MVAQLTSTEAYQELLSLALEDRSSGYQDLVSNSNALLAVPLALAIGGPGHDEAGTTRIVLFQTGHQPVDADRQLDPLTNGQLRVQWHRPQLRAW